MAKALLILFGGRIIPNVLTILYLKPQVIVPIVSADELKRLDDFKKGVDDLLKKEGHSCEWLNSKTGKAFVINAHKKDDIKRICTEVVRDHKGYEWTFNITSGTSLMSIGAYEAAKELAGEFEKERIPFSCWYLNTARRTVEVLVGVPGSSTLDEAVFQISTEQYATAHNKVLEIRENNLSSRAKLLEFAQWLAKSSAYIKALSKLLTEKDNDNPSVEFQMRKPKDEQGYYTCERLIDSNEKAVLKKAASYGLIQELTTTTSSLSFKISSQQFLFLNGGWLELFVENEVAGIKNRENGQPLFQDIGRNRHVHNKTGQGYNKQEENELDVSMIYNAQLFIIECKAGSKVTRPETIFKLDSVANAFGAGFVGKYLVTALSKRDIEKKLGNNGQIEKNIFEERLEIRKIRLLTWEDLENLKDIFRTEATEPEYPRI